MNSWTASRDGDFMFYLLGKVVGLQYEQFSAKMVGQWTAYALLGGGSLDAAIVFGRPAYLYDGAVYDLTQRIADAMRFLVEDKNAMEQQGRTITTMMDMFHRCRKINTKPIMFIQPAFNFNCDI